VRHCERAHAARGGASVHFLLVEEFFLHLWDELDDLAGIARHLAASTVAEAVAAVAPLIAAASGALLAGATTLLLAHRQLLRIFA